MIERVVDFVTGPELRNFLTALTAVLAGIITWLGTHNRRELRDGLGVTKGSRKHHPKDLKPREALERSDELPMRALLETSLQFSAGLDDRLERVERRQEAREERDAAGVAGELDRRAGGHA